jgi:hypothetical protein
MTRKQKLAAGIVAYCNYKWHRGDMTMEMVRAKSCPDKQCKYFSWLSTKAAKKWRMDKLYNQ